MLQNIRDNAQGLVAKIIIGLIAISFAFFGVESLIGGGQTDVATVNGEDISQTQLNQAMLTERNRRMQLMGENFDPAMLEESVLRKPAVEQLVQQTLLLQIADKADIDIAAAALDQTIISMSQFQENGQFSSQLFQNVLRSNGLTPGYFKNLLRTDLIIGQISSGVAASDFITEKELEQIVEVVGEKRSFKFLMIPGDEVAKSIEVSDAEIEEYYSQNEQQFKTEDRVKLEYLEIKQEDFFEPVSEEAIREAYELELADFKGGEERRVSHILIEVNDSTSDQEAMQQAIVVKERLDGGDSFESLAAEFSDDLGSASTGGDLGYTAGETFPGEFEEALFELSLNEISAPVKTESGYHLIKATEIKLSDKPEFTDRKSILAQQIKQQRSEADFVSAVEELRDLVFNSEGLKGPADELGLTVSESDWVSRNTRIDPLGNSQVIKAAFSESVLEERNNSEVIELAEDHFIVVHVMEHDLPHTKPLDDVEETIVATLTQEKTTEALKFLAQKATEELAAGKEPQDIADQLGGSWTEQKQLKRTALGVNRELLASVFGLSAASEMPYAESITLNSGDVALVILEEILPGVSSELSAAELMAIRTEMQRSISAANIRNFVQSVRQSSEIEIL